VDEHTRIYTVVISAELSDRRPKRARRSQSIRRASSARPAQSACLPGRTIDASTLNLTFLSLLREMRANISSIA